MVFAKDLWAKFFLLILLTLPLSSHAESSKKKIPIDPAQTLKIVYGSAPWNTDSTKIDTAYIFVRDGSTGKMVKILLEETEPDSSTFQGFFSLGWAGMEEVYRQVYVPPQNLRKGEANSKKFSRMIIANKVQRRPIVFKKTTEGTQILDVYDTREQAERAYKIHKRQKKLQAAQEEEKKSLAKPIPSKSQLEIAAALEKKKALAKLLKEATEREMNRVRMEQLERQKQAQRIAEQQRLKAAELKARQDRAQKLSKQAIEAFKNGQYQLAEDLFRQSVALDPSNKSYYYYFGVTLFKNKKYNEALVTLKISNPPEEETNNRNYYIALTHYKLKELQPALEQFRIVRKSKHPILAPSSAFYEGLILFSLEKLKKAKEPFEWVIDNSKDPKLDDKAENYLEKIAAMMAFKKKQSETYIINLMGGAQYDSNILFSPDGQESSQGSATEKGGFRALGTANFEYRPIYGRTSEFSVKVNSLAIYSVDSTFSKADPYLVGLATPYAWKGTWAKRGYKLSLSPGYEMLYMDANDDGSAESLLNSIIFNTDFTLVMSSEWFASYKLDARMDDSFAADSTGDTDADALKYTLKTSHTFLLDKTKKRAFIAGGGVTINNANGKDKKFTRIDLNFVYSQPFKTWKDASWNTGLSTYKLNYNDASTTREDTNITLNGGITKPWKKDLNWGVNASYSSNQSNISTNAYSKYTIMGTISYKWAK